MLYYIYIMKKKYLSIFYHDFNITSNQAKVTLMTIFLLTSCLFFFNCVNHQNFKVTGTCSVACEKYVFQTI